MRQGLPERERVRSAYLADDRIQIIITAEDIDCPVRPDGWGRVDVPLRSMTPLKHPIRSDCVDCHIIE